MQYVFWIFNLSTKDRSDSDVSHLMGTGVKGQDQPLSSPWGQSVSATDQTA